MEKEEIKKLSDKDLLEMQHDTEVDCVNDLSLNREILTLYKLLNEEIKFRNLKELPRLNGFY